MALFPAPILTNGATHSAQQFRMLVRDLANGAEGITAGSDLKVTQLGTPGGSVQVGVGSGVVKGRVSAFQGHYAVCNTAAVTVAIAPTSGTGRSDMLILRVEDPEYEGTLNPATDQIAYFQIISNVSSSATTIPDGRTGIPLARIDIPSSTATITNAMIKDIRACANPRTLRRLFTQSPASASANISGTSGTMAYFSTAAGWNVAIPDWASSAIVSITIGGLRGQTGSFYGALGATFGASLGVQTTLIDDNGGTGVRRSTQALADTLTIPDAYRGTTQLLRVQATGYAGNAGVLNVDNVTTFIYDIQFSEAPR
ncbi:hypothetical protein ABZ829_27935 [Streptomyces xanthochromogenes]|uniref:hypothetical protein n=1 Tax=Streptomyces xanthochromogenes TaxID=67384 RepID=UPI0034148470